MSARYFVELLSRNGDVLRRQQVDHLPIRIGRGYDNEVILDDPHTAASHALIEAGEDGRLTLRDLGSKNGAIVRGKRQTAVALDGDTVVRLGHTSLRVRDAAYPVAPEWADTTNHGWEGALPAAIGMLLTALSYTILTWLGDVQTFQLTRYLQAIAGALAVGLAWAGIWTFATRLFAGRARLGRHLFIVGCGLCAVLAFKLVSGYSAYAFSLEWLTRYGSHVGILIVCVAVFYHLRMIRPQHPRRLAGYCLILLLLGSGLRLMSNEQSTGRLGDELYMPLLLSPSLRVSPDHSVDEFLASGTQLKAKLDVDRNKKVKDDGETDDED